MKHGIPASSRFILICIFIYQTFIVHLLQIHSNLKQKEMGYSKPWQGCAETRQVCRQCWRSPGAASPWSRSGEQGQAETKRRSPKLKWRAFVHPHPSPPNPNIQSQRNSDSRLKSGSCPLLPPSPRHHHRHPLLACSNLPEGGQVIIFKK